MTTIAIVQAPEGPSVMSMFLTKGYACYAVSTPEDLDLHRYDLVCFVGGEDVSPIFYWETKHPKTHNNIERDRREADIYDAIPQNTPKVGICRGGQFLNVMNGGKIIQHIEGHRNTVHLTMKGWGYDPWDYIELNSDHHQMMVPTENAKLIASVEKGTEITDGDVEVLWYPNTKSLCFQPHPEWGHKPTEDYFFELLKRYYKL